MAAITLGGQPTNTNANLPAIGSKIPEFSLSRNDLTTVSNQDFKGQQVVFNIFPSVDTGVCATSVKKFNEQASKLENTKVLCISRDLPFAQARFCGAEGIDQVETLSDFNTGKFGNDFGVTIQEGPFSGLHARAIVVVNGEGFITHTELVPEIGQEPNYDAALNAL